MPGSHPVRWIILLCATLATFGCANTDTDQGATGSLSLDLVLAGDIQIDVVDWQITGNGMDMGGSVDVSAPGSTASVEVYGLPVGQEPYVVELSAVSVDQEVTCRGSAEFDVEVGVSTPVMVILNCKLPQELGGVRVNGTFNICAQLSKLVVSPLQTSVGNEISLFSAAQDEEGDPIAYMWSSNSGSIANPAAPTTTYTCTEAGDDDITILVSDDGGAYCMSMWTVRVTCVDGDGGTGGSGGAGGAGGMGGSPAGTATVTAAHFAPEVPSPVDTAVAIYVNGDEVTALGTIEYGQTTGRVELPAPGTYDIGIGLPGGDGPLLELTGVELNDGDDIAAAAYRTNDELPVALFAYDLSTTGLEQGSGRVFVSHGANDAALNPVDIIVTDEGACPPPLLDDLAFGETRVEGGLDLPATTYNLGFDRNPGDCEAELRFGAPVTEAVTTVLVAVDEAVGAGLAPQVWALVDAETVVALITPDLCEGVVCDDTGNDCTAEACNSSTGMCETSNVGNGTECNDGEAGTCQEGVCVPNPECVEPADCSDDGNECTDPVCNAGTCETSNNTNACDGGAGTCSAGVCEPNAAVFYEQDFESLDQASGTALGTAPGGAGFQVFGNEFQPNGTFIQGYGPFTAPNGTPGFCSIALGQGGGPQGDQVLVIYSDYNNNVNQTAGNLVEANTFQEPFANPGSLITSADFGTYTFSFDAKRGDINNPADPVCASPNVCDSTAVAFIKTLNPAAGFATTNNITLETTTIPDTWNRYSISIVIDNALLGQILQFGFAATATNFEPSGVFYDNLLVTVE